MRVNYRCEEFISIDEIPEIYGVKLYDGLFDSVYTNDKFILVKESEYNDLMSIIKKLKIDICFPVINEFTIISCSMLNGQISEDKIMGFIESDFNKFVSVKYMNDFYKHDQLL